MQTSLAPSQVWSSALTSSLSPDVGIPGVGSYNTLSDPLPSITTPAVTPVTASPVSLGSTLSGLTGILTASPATWGIYAGVILLAILLLVLGVYVLLQG